MAYNFKEVEKKWQDKWEKEGTFNAKNDYSNKKKWYGLIEFPYPSGQGLHVGHPRSYTALDVIARKRRLQGYNVLFPIGFDQISFRFGERSNGTKGAGVLHLSRSDGEI